MSRIALSDICSYRTESGPIDPLTYISTESILPNRAGVTKASSIPTTGKAKLFRRGDTLVSNIRPYFKKIWQATEDGCCSADVLVFKPSACHADYLYWLLSSDAFFDYMVATSKGTKMPRGDKAAIMQYESVDMSIEDQRGIAMILNPIRGLIELNQQINDYLEEMGQLFLAGYYENCSSDCKLAEIMALGSGFAFKSDTYTDVGRYKVLTIKNVQDGNVDCSTSNRVDKIPSKMKKYCKLKLGDVVLSLTGNVGRVGIVAERNCLLNQRVAVLQPKNPKLLAALYFLFRDKTFQNEMIGIARGTAQANLSPLETVQLSVPYNETGLLELSSVLTLIFDLILRNKIESAKLSDLRDTLLPKLISGEIDVSKVDVTQLNNHLSDC